MSREAGFTYVGLVFFVAILGLVGAATLKVDSLLRRAAAEQDLLEIGAEFSEALRSYAAATPRGYPTAPPTLQDLLKDPRFPGTRRHLRKIFVDPITGKDEWGIVYQGDKIGVLAVYSLSRAQPLKVANFDARFLNFENKEHLSEWKFTATGQGVSVTAPNNVTPPATPGTPAPLFPAPGAAPAPGAPPAPPPEQPAQPEPEAEPPVEP
ncbi:MAG: type II secretion system protein, partial [Pseudomonadota bacterium]